MLAPIQRILSPGAQELLHDCSRRGDVELRDLESAAMADMGGWRVTESTGPRGLEGVTVDSEWCYPIVFDCVI